MIFPENFKGSACRKDGIGNAKVEYWSNDGGGGIWGEKTCGKIYGRKLQAHVRIRLSAKLVLAAARGVLT